MTSDFLPTPQFVGVSTLPQELVDIIIDLFHDDWKTLETFCLVHRAWLLRSRKHLFRDVMVRYKMEWAFGKKSLHIPGVGEQSIDKTSSNQELWMSLFTAFVDFLTRAPSSVTENIQRLSLLGKHSFARGGYVKTDWTAEQYEAWTISLTTDAIHSLLRLLPNLRELRLHLDLHQSTKIIPTDRFPLRTLSLNWCLASTDCLFLLISLLPDLRQLRWAVWERTPKNTPLGFLVNAPQQLVKDLTAKRKRGRLLLKLSRIVVKPEPQQLHEGLLELLESACNIGQDEERSAISLDLSMALSTSADVVRCRRLFKLTGDYVRQLTLRPARTKGGIELFSELIQQDAGLSYCLRLRCLHIDLAPYWRGGVTVCLTGLLKDLFKGKHRPSPEGLTLMLSLDNTLAHTWHSEDTFKEVDRTVAGYKKYLSEVFIAKGGETPDDEQKQEVIEYMPELQQADLLRF